MDKPLNETPHQVRLTASEIANIWSQFQNDTMAICIYNYLINTTEDAAIREVLEFALSLAKKHIGTIKEYFIAEKFPIPHGFTEDDVDINAPKLYSDEFCLTYTYIMCVYGLAGYAAALSTNIRRDIRDYFVECQDETMELFNRSLDLMLSKGIVSRPPYINPPENYEFVQSKHYMKGILGGERPLNSIEISNVHWDLKKLQVEKALCISFAQVAKNEEVKKFFWRGVELEGKQIEILGSVLSLSHLPSPKSEESEITSSTIAPFSDRLMMFHKMIISSATMGLFGSAVATSQRLDLGMHYSRFSMELADYMVDGFKIMIKHKWAEQVPLSDDRKHLAGQ